MVAASLLERTKKGSMTRFRFSAIGDNSVDRFQALISRSLIGGSALAVAVQLALKGHEASFFGAVCRDADGRRTREALAAYGILTCQFRMTDDKTACTEVASPTPANAPGR